MTSCTTTTCGVGGWGGPLPGDPDNNVILTATTAFGGIDVSWTYPTTNPAAVAHVLLYRGTSANYSSAIMRATVGGNFFYDKSSTSSATQYWYWIQIVSVNGTVGALIGPASAVAKPTIANVIEGLTAQIDSGLLAQSLKTEIDKITLNYQDLLDEVDARIAANTAFSQALGQVQSGVTQALTFINEEITQRQEGDSAVVTQLNTVAAANAANLALIQQEQTARVDGDSANAQLYTTLNSQVNNATTGLPATRATLTNDYYTKASTDSAISSAVSSLVSTTALNNALGNYTNTAALTTNYFTKTETNSAISSAVSTLASTTAVNTALANYTNTATLQQNYYTKTSTDNAISAAITTSQTTLNGNIASAQTTLQTNINTVNGAVTAIGALYTAKVTVNGLIGGFGIYNDGSTVEAGFDVDTFWVGKTGANKRKPFIITNGQVFMDQAVINQLTFTKLRDESGAVMVENGKLKADYIQTVEIMGGDYTGYAWPAAGTTGFYLGPSGLLLGNYNNGKYLQVDIPTGTFNLNGKFTSDALGNVVADRVDIRRRVVLQSGTVQPPAGVSGSALGYYSEYGQEGVYYSVDYSPGASWSFTIGIATSIYDSYAFDSVNNQPYYVAAVADGPFTQYNGGVTSFNVQCTGVVLPKRQYSNSGIFTDDYRLTLQLTMTVTLLSGVFTSFRFPAMKWAIYKL